MINNNVLLGSDGYLFLYDGRQRSFAFSTGEVRPTAQDVINLSNNLELRSKYFSSRGIPFLHVIYPSKEIVIKDKVPSPWRERIRSLFLSHYVAAQPFLADMALYPLDELIALNLIQPAFHVLDTHMTDAGTMAVTQLILKQWGLQYDATKFFVINKEKAPGDLANMLNIKDRVSEDFYKPKFPYLTFDNRSYLPGNSDNVCIYHCPESITEKRLLIFGDSFIKYALPFFGPVFRDVVYVRSATSQKDMVNLMLPDFVISSNAERYLCKVGEDDKSIPMFFSHYGKTDYSPSPDFIEAYKAQFSYNHHRSTYETWSQKMLKRFLRWEGLGECQPNHQLEVVDLAGSFRSIGLDPYFTFSRPSITPEKRYVFECDLLSDIESIATVYFQVEGDERFSESKTVKLPVNCGNNKLQFFLPNFRLKSILRFDPLNCKGNFTVKNAVLRIVH